MGISKGIHTPYKMARGRVLTDEERVAHKRAANAAWRQRNREALRARRAELAALPAVQELRRQYRRALYRDTRQALLDSGFVPNPVGRPRKRTAEEAREIHRRSNRDYIRRRREDAALQDLPDEPPCSEATAIQEAAPSPEVRSNGSC